MIHLVNVPRVNANEDEILVTSVAVSVGDWVDVGRELFVVESSKAAVTVEAQVAGYVRSIFAKTDDLAAVGSTLCLIADTQEESLPDLEQAGGAAEGGEGPPSSGVSPRPTAKERLEARQAAHGAVGAGSSLEPPITVMSVEVVASQELPWVREARSKLGELSNGDTGLVATTYGSLPLSQDGETYQSNGVYIGPGARMGAGSLVSAKRLYLGPGAQIGSNCRLEADSVYIGANAKIGNHTDIVTGELILEDGTVVADQVVVDLAGGRSEESRLLVGGGSLISSRVIINTSREVVLDRESALSPGAMVFTHSFWQSVLERYSVASEGVRVCENAWVGAGCQIMPGVTIGPGSVVMSNSTVVEHVPPFSLVGGVPARLIRSNIRRELDHKEQATILLKTVRDFIRGLEFTGCAVEGTPDPGTFSITLPDGANRHLTLLTAGQSPRSIVPSNSILITFGQEVSVSDQASVFDVTSRTFAGAEDRLTHELRNFLRRHGIRFRPYAWDPSHTRGL